MNKFRTTLLPILSLFVVLFNGVLISFANKQPVLTEEQKRQIERANPRVLEYYNGLGLDYLAKKQYTEADTLYTYLLTTYEKQQPGSDINWAQIILKGKADVLLNLAMAKQGQNNDATAIPLYERSLKIQDQISPINHDIAQKDRAYAGLIQSYDKLGKKAEADKWRAIKKAADSKKN